MGKIKAMTGNQSASMGACLSRPDVIAAYPITPQSSVVEGLAGMIANGKSDAHTKLNIMSDLPINFRIFDNEIIVNYPEELKGNILLSINGINIETIVNEIDNIISYGTEVKKNMKLKNLFLINIDYLVFHLLETQKN